MKRKFEIGDKVVLDTETYWESKPHAMVPLAYKPLRDLLDKIKKDKFCYIVSFGFRKREYHISIGDTELQGVTLVVNQMYLQHRLAPHIHQMLQEVK